MKFILLLFLLSTAQVSGLWAQDIDPDDVNTARRDLQDQRELLQRNTDFSLAERASRMLDLGLWQEAATLLRSEQIKSKASALVEVRYYMLQNAFATAKALLMPILTQYPTDDQALLLEAQLLIQSWELPQAWLICEELLREDSLHQEALLLSGRIQMLRKQYPEAMKVAKLVQRHYTTDARGFLLESEVHFWNRDPVKAEVPLRTALRADPFNSDARFYYGYALWRRVDARLLPKMAEQWELALEVDPLHYNTHWHWGNGHTHLTYADYKRSDDEEVRQALEKAERQIKNQNPAKAIRIATEIQEAYPASVLPAMFTGSAYYMWYAQPASQRIDSAQRYFQQTLRKKAHYGPAHNGLAACIKLKRMQYLKAFAELEETIAQESISDSTLLTALFPDVAYYPGERVAQIIQHYLHDTKAFFPLLVEQEINFRIPPLHIDLARAMDNYFFLEATTFDNRQWMDIRGVGSGASGIEYLERGAHLERNVLLHEYVHLFHNSAFTDEETRIVRRLFFNAKRQNRVLDYYAANNEHEYLAQIIPAYYSEVKVHPLNHKSVNTVRDLKEKDPEAFAFVQNLVTKLQAYMEGDTMVLASNWAQVYVNKALKRMDGGENPDELDQEWALLEKAFDWDSTYLPAFVAAARFSLYEGDEIKAERWISQGLAINDRYADLYLQSANLTKLKRIKSILDTETGLQTEERFLQQAIQLEMDLMKQSEYITRLRDYYFENNNYLDAMTVARNYARQVPMLSTYLKDQRDNMSAFANWLRGSIGYSSSSLDPMKELVQSKPQDYILIGQYADVLTAAGKYIQSITELERAQKILSAAGDLNTNYMTQVAENYLIMNDQEGARRAIEPILNGLKPYDGNPYRLVRVYAGIGMVAEARSELNRLISRKEEHWQAEYHYSRSKILQAEAQPVAAEEALRISLQINPYHHLARVDLIRMLSQNGQKTDAINVLQDAMSLALPLGPDFSAKILRYISD